MSRPDQVSVAACLFSISSPEVTKQAPAWIEISIGLLEPGGLEFEPGSAKCDDRRQQNLCVLEHDFLQAGVLADPDKHRPHNALHGYRHSSLPWKALFTPQD